MRTVKQSMKKAVTLYVVIESAVFVPVFLQKPERVVVAEVFKLNQTTFAISET